MTQLYNRTSEKAKRQQLRRNITKAELIIWQKLKSKQLEGYKFRRQYSVSSFVIDFYCTELKLAIEIDGDSHFEEGSQEYDRESSGGDNEAESLLNQGFRLVTLPKKFQLIDRVIDNE